jgi:hypothetical protein
MDQVTAWSLVQESLQSLKCRAMEAAVWGMPLVNFDAMRQALFRDVNSGYNDILYQSRVADWKFQVPTPNSVTPYVMFFINTKQDGPMVVEVPPGTENALRGTLIDAWSVPVIDISNEGEGQGKRKRYLLLPPDYREAVPAGYIPVHCKTYNSYSLGRVISKAFGDEGVQKGIAYLKQLRIYPLTQSRRTPYYAIHRYIGKALRWCSLPQCELLCEPEPNDQRRASPGEGPRHARHALAAWCRKRQGIQTQR